VIRRSGIGTGNGVPRHLRTATVAEALCLLRNVTISRREKRGTGNCFLQIVDQHRLVDLFAAQVTLHQRFVFGLLDDSLVPDWWCEQIE
jgi:hypothetical protein